MKKIIISDFYSSLKESNQKLNESIASVESQASTTGQAQPSSEGGEAEALIAESAAKIEELENKLEEVRKEKEKFETKCTSSEENLAKYKEKTREILNKAKESVNTKIQEKKNLEEKLKG